MARSVLLEKLGGLKFAVICLVACLVASPAGGAKKEAPAGGQFEIPAWFFDRGNAKVYANPDIYADYRDTYPELVAGDSGKTPWVVEYDVDFPVDATYTLHVRYASPEPRPLDVRLDGKSAGECCRNATDKSAINAYRRPRLSDDDRPGYPSKRHGAEWAEAVKLSVAKGVHTLKFTRDGTPPNLVALRLVSPVSFPKDWKPRGPLTMLSQRKGGERSRYEAGWKESGSGAKVDRIPPIYRRAFLPPGIVNIATLRLAVEDTIKEFGPRYPAGPKYLKQLGALEKKHGAAADGSPDRQEIADALASLQRQAMLAHPLLNFDKLLFVKRAPLNSGHIYEDHCSGRTMGGNLCILSPASQGGKVTELVPELSGGLFAQFDLSFDAKKIVFAYKKGSRKPYRIYEVGVDGKGLRQITSEGPDEAEMILRYEGTQYGRGYDDIFPCYLPNGKIMFASTRSKKAVFCAPVTVTTLHVMDADGGNIRCLSDGPVTEIAPRVLDDGRVIYMRWEYVDKGFGNVQSLWSMRPDGSGSAHVYKSDVILPAGMVDARSIPGSTRIVTIGAPHCGMSAGPVVLVDNRLDRRSAVSMTNITPELAYPGMSPHRSGRTFGYFKEPYPLSEKVFVVSHYNPALHAKGAAGYGLYVLDAWGNRAEFYRDPEISCFQATPLRPRRRPTVITPVADSDATDARESIAQGLATIFMQDVYQGMTGIERGRVKYLRVMEAIGISWDAGYRSSKQRDGAGLQASAVSLKCDVNIKKIHGIATVYKDGSAHFTVPAEKNIFFQALDENYMELQRMRTFVNLMPGEKRSCIGCHERRQRAPRMVSGRPLASKHPAETLRPQPGDTKPRTIHYALDIRPLLDKHCIGCHGAKEPKGDLDLTGELTKLYDRSYENFIEKGLVANLNDGYGSANVAPERPLTFGSHRSKLIQRIRKAPCKAKLTGEEFIRIVTWVDANAPYFGTHRGKKNLKWKDDADFRPLPPGRK